MTNVNRHPMQPIYLDGNGVARFQKNEIVRYLLDTFPGTMNALAMMPFGDADREQFAQLIGYSVDGFAELNYSSPAAIASADAAGAALRDYAVDTPAAVGTVDYLTFQEFVVSKVWCDDIGKKFGDETETGMAFVYADTCFINMVTESEGGPHYRLLIERREWIGRDISKFERILWALHYLPESGAMDTPFRNQQDATAFCQGMLESWDKTIDAELYANSVTWTPADAVRNLTNAVLFAAP